MYTYTINKKEGNTAFVTLHNNTGETETYTEQVTVSDAVFATEDTPFIPPVFEIVEHVRPKIVNTEARFTFTDDADLVSQIENVIYNIENPEITPALEQVAVPEPTPEEIAAKEAAEAKAIFLEKLALWDAQRVAGIFITSRGGTISNEDGLAFKQLEDWLLSHWKPEYALEAKPYLTALGINIT